MTGPQKLTTLRFNVKEFKMQKIMSIHTPFNTQVTLFYMRNGVVTIPWVYIYIHIYCVLCFVAFSATFTLCIYHLYSYYNICSYQSINHSINHHTMSLTITTLCLLQETETPLWPYKYDTIEITNMKNTFHANNDNMIVLVNGLVITPPACASFSGQLSNYRLY